MSFSIHEKTTLAADFGTYQFPGCYHRFFIDPFGTFNGPIKNVQKIATMQLTITKMPFHKSFNHRNISIFLFVGYMWNPLF
jgi:hypothetical protein